MKSLFEIGGLTPNEARRMMDMPRVKDGDQPLVNNAMVPLSFVTGKKNDVTQQVGNS